MYLTFLFAILPSAQQLTQQVPTNTRQITGEVACEVQKFLKYCIRLCTLLDGSLSAQDYGPDAIQFVGPGLPEEMAATTGARNPFFKEIVDFKAIIR